MRPRPLIVLAAFAALVATLVGAPVQAAAPAPEPAASAPAAARALADVQALLAPATPGFRGRAVSRPGTRDATFAIRDLRTQRDDLSAADRATADRLLARPSTGRSRCFTTFCVHWSRSGRHAARSGYVTKVAATVKHVLATYAKAGYRRPKPDGRRGGNKRLDIYLSNLGGQGLYGYCDSEGNPPVNGPYDTWAYCAFDNDFAEFPAHTPLQNLQVTAAHELFHAVQFGYDYYEDAWFMEATAVWAEDELYDDVDDNLQYLSASPMTQPGRSMDQFGGVWHYGEWIFFRFLTERYPDAEGGLPTLVRDMWELADGSRGAADHYSIDAVARALEAVGADVPAVFADFADANRRPRGSYDEGRANDYPVAPLSRSVDLTDGDPDSGWLTEQVDHLASTTTRFVREPGTDASTLDLSLDLPGTSRGSAAVVTVGYTSGAPQSAPVELSGGGDATGSLEFGDDVRYVEVTLVNAGLHYACWRRTSFSCQGTSGDDNLAFTLRASLVP